MKVIYLLIALLAGCIHVQAQIGYQVSLLDNATGNPRANETVSITVQITNCEGGTIYSQTSSETWCWPRSGIFCGGVRFLGQIEVDKR